MAEARLLKLREYNTNIIAHDTTTCNAEAKPHRNTNTFKS